MAATTSPLCLPCTGLRSSRACSSSSLHARPAARAGLRVRAAVEQQEQRRQQGGRRSAAALAAAAAVLGSPAAALAADPTAAAALFELAALDSKTAGALSWVLKPTLSLASLAMIVRIVMTWYPEVDGTKLPWAVAYYPTESLLAATRKVVKPFNGLDVSPIVWVALLSFVSEILTGPQGILSLIQRKGI